jgi:hypothetical protein
VRATVAALLLFAPGLGAADPGPPTTTPPAPPSAPAADKPTEPFSEDDWTWTSGNARTKDSPLGNDVFTAEFRLDTSFHYDLAHPKDHTIGGSSEVFRSGELEVTQLGFGGDLHHDNVMARFMTQLGMYATTTHRGDASPSKGQWQLNDAYRYLSEAYGGYHLDVMHGLNLQAGMFMSYVGLWSYYQFDNWTYQPSFVSMNTPWYFNGGRIQLFPTARLKIEAWLVNGWQSYGKFNQMPGGGFQVNWRPTGDLSLVTNLYEGTDTLNNASRHRIHSDNSVQYKYLDAPGDLVTKAALTLTVDAGCESGGGVSCAGGGAASPSQYFLGFMAYNRVWVDHDRYAVTIGGGAVTNPGRYLVLLPPINGATATSGTPYFSVAPGDPFKAWDGSLTVDYLPKQFITLRLEFNHRWASVPYFSGPGGITPEAGNQGAPGSVVPGFTPDLQKSEDRFTAAMLIKI